MSLLSVQDVMSMNSAAESALPFPIIADDKRELSVQLGMLDPDERDKDGLPLTARCVRNLSSLHTPVATVQDIDHDPNLTDAKCQKNLSSLDFITCERFWSSFSNVVVVDRPIVCVRNRLIIHIIQTIPSSYLCVQTAVHMLKTSKQSNLKKCYHLEPKVNVF